MGRPHEANLLNLAGLGWWRLGGWFVAWSLKDLSTNSFLEFQAWLTCTRAQSAAGCWLLRGPDKKKNRPGENEIPSLKELRLDGGIGLWIRWSKLAFQSDWSPNAKDKVWKCVSMWIRDCLRCVSKDTNLVGSFNFSPSPKYSKILKYVEIWHCGRWGHSTLPSEDEDEFRRLIPFSGPPKTRRRIPKTNSPQTISPRGRSPLRRRIPKTNSRRRISPWRRITPKTNSPPKTNSKDEFPAGNSPPKTTSFPKTSSPHLASCTFNHDNWNGLRRQGPFLWIQRNLLHEPLWSPNHG